MNLTKAVVLLETKYKPVKEWPDGKVIPRDLPEDEEVKKAWKVIIDNRDQKTPKEIRIQKTKDIYKDFSKRKEEMKQDILDGYSLRELSRKYGPKDMIRGLKRVKLYDLFKKMCPLKIGWYAYNGQNTTFFKNIEEYLQTHQVEKSFIKSTVRMVKALKVMHFIAFRSSKKLILTLRKSLMNI